MSAAGVIADDAKRRNLTTAERRAVSVELLKGSPKLEQLCNDGYSFRCCEVPSIRLLNNASSSGHDDCIPGDDF